MELKLKFVHNDKIRKCVITKVSSSVVLSKISAFCPYDKSKLSAQCRRKAEIKESLGR